MKDHEGEIVGQAYLLEMQGDSSAGSGAGVVCESTPQTTPRVTWMLKKLPSCVLGSEKSSTYPRGYASGFSSPASLLAELFEHPVGSC